MKKSSILMILILISLLLPACLLNEIAAEMGTYAQAEDLPPVQIDAGSPLEATATLTAVAESPAKTNTATKTPLPTPTKTALPVATKIPQASTTPFTPPPISATNPCFTWQNFLALKKAPIPPLPSGLPPTVMGSPGVLWPDYVSIIDVASGSENQITKGFGATVSPNGRYIAFINQDIQLAIYDSEVGKWNGFTVTHRTGVTINTFWSPDSEWIALLSSYVGADGMFDIHIIKRDGTQLQKVGSAPKGTLMQVSWVKATKSQLLQVMDLDEKWLTEVKVDGELLGTIVVSNQAPDNYQIISPDLGWIMSVETMTGGVGVFMINTATREKRLMYDHRMAMNELRVWTPDSNWFAVSFREGNHYTPVLVSPETCEVRRYTSYGGPVIGWLGESNVAQADVATILPTVFEPDETCAADWSRLHTEMWAVVMDYTEDLANNLRAEPLVDDNIIGRLPVGTVVKIVDGPVCADGFVFWRVSDETGMVLGWTAEGDGVRYYLEPVE